MARVHSVQHARKEGLRCGKCGEAITPGQPYRWWKHRRGGGGIRCGKPTCAPRRSEYSTTSPYRAAAYDVQDEIDDLAGGVDFDPGELQSALENAADTVESDCAEALRDSASNIVDGFGHDTAQSDELNERADAFDDWERALRDAAAEVEGLIAEFEEVNEDAAREHLGDDADEEAIEDWQETERERIREEMREAAGNASAECPE